MVSVVYGPSGSGKSNRLISSYARAKSYKLPVIILKPKMSGVPGYPQREVRTHDGIILRQDIYVYGEDELPPPEDGGMYSFLFVEDAHFFSVEEVRAIIASLYMSFAKNIVFYGAKEDYAGIPFESIEYLLNHERAVSITEELKTNCYFCQTKIATKTQRLVNGVRSGPGPRVFFADFVKHVPACSDCYAHPDRVAKGELKEG